MAGVLSAKVITYLREHPNSVLATVEGGKPSVRAMWIVRVDDDGAIWYATPMSSEKVRHLAANPQVALTAHTERDSVRVTGAAELVTDQAVKTALWHKSWSAYFTGADDPAYALLKITPTWGEFA